MIALPYFIKSGGGGGRWGFPLKPQTVPFCGRKLSLSSRRNGPLREWAKGVLHMIGTPFLKLNAYKARVRDVSPQRGIEQIREGGISPCPIPKADNSFLGKD